MKEGTPGGEARTIGFLMVQPVQGHQGHKVTGKVKPDA
jgi:hypothetical protein